MTSATHTEVITFLSLLRKYRGRIMDATEEERRAAASVPRPKFQNPLNALFQAMRDYRREEVGE